jgi:hypothetical protein
MIGQAGARQQWSCSSAHLQAKRLDELDRLYRDEALARKKTHNAMEDLKVGQRHCAGSCA